MTRPTNEEPGDASGPVPHSVTQGSHKRIEVRLAGMGGQGLVLAGLLLAKAVALYDGKNAVQSQSYGAQQRGGPSQSEVVISDGEIDYPRVVSADILVALTQEACDQHYLNLRKGGVLIVDSGLVDRVPTSHAYCVPVTELSRESTGRPIAASIVALGLLVELTGIVSEEALRSALASDSPRGALNINLRAMEAGLEAGRKLKGTSSL
ncbi:MAG: 2-oxoacid:acceptor oxidoreductase family protein [Dehalococcoidia bacterium]|nr:2-oxoacid:acceptor oxidoreductase family protein [Dehalococcoidia bacterium]